MRSVEGLGGQQDLLEIRCSLGGQAALLRLAIFHLVMGMATGVEGVGRGEAGLA